MPAADYPQGRDTAVTHMDSSVGVIGLAIESDQLEPVPDGGAKKKGIGFGAWLAIVWILGLLALAILAPVLPIPDPNESFAEIARQGPVAGHILGGDSNGRDLFSRIIWGTRASFAVGFGAVAFGLVIGGFLGLITGFFRGRIDGVITPLMTILLAIPQFVLALSLVTVLSAGDNVSSTQRIGVVILGHGRQELPHHVP